MTVFPEMFGRNWRSPTAGLREAKPLEAPRASHNPQLGRIALQLDPTRARDFAHQQSARNQVTKRRAEGRADSPKPGFSLALPGRAEAVHPDLLAMWCLPCYSGEKYPTPKVLYPQLPLHALCSTGSSPGEGVWASLPHPHPIPVQTRWESEAARRGYKDP